MQASLNLKKERMKFKVDENNILIPLRGKEGMGQWEFVKDTVTIEETYQTTVQEDHELTKEGEIPLPIMTSIVDSEQRIYEWKM